jgi:CheY-like chemotaxis protein
MGRNHFLFLVDDDADDHEIFRSALAHVDEKITLLVAGNGQDALKMLSAQERLPDFIFADLNMPRMGGIQFLAEIKKSETLQNIPVIVYSTSNHPDDKGKAMDAGATKFITKPAKFSELCELLQKLLHQIA